MQIIVSFLVVLFRFDSFRIVSCVFFYCFLLLVFYVFLFSSSLFCILLFFSTFSFLFFGIPSVLRGRRLQVRFWLEFWKPCCRNPSYFTSSAFGNQLLARVLGALMSKSLVFYEVGACNRTWGSIHWSRGGRSVYTFLLFRYFFLLR